MKLGFLVKMSQVLVIDLATQWYTLLDFQLKGNEFESQRRNQH